MRTTHTLTHKPDESVLLHDKQLQLHTLKAVYEQVENLGYSLGLYPFTVTTDIPGSLIQQSP